MAQSVAGRWVGEGKGVKDSQHFLAELRDFQVIDGPNSHHFHGSVASFDMPSPGVGSGPAPPPWRTTRNAWPYTRRLSPTRSPAIPEVWRPELSNVTAAAAPFSGFHGRER